jgi:hypothetical protein
VSNFEVSHVIAANDDEASNQQAQGISHILEDNTKSDSCRQLAGQWLNICLETHPRCGQMTADSPMHLPSRVVDVGLPGDTDVRLHVSLPEEKDRYLTLSHRWGLGDVPKLTRSNYAQLEKGFSVKDLPRTFRDTIEVTRSLGIRYLWVDSLCIFQDSAEDWKIQASCMGSIYRNCLCNIAATVAEDGNSGLFFYRNVNAALPLKTNINWTIERSSKIYHCVYTKLWENQVERAPLNTRGWVLQERLLSPRVLHCGSKQIFWQCHQNSACETYPSGIPDLSKLSSFRTPTHIFELLERLRPQEESSTARAWDLRAETYEAWWDLVEAYSYCDLTRKEDKLVAIAGIANETQLGLQDDYLCGLWKKELDLGLLWRAIKCERQGQKFPILIQPMRTPSWSWASVDGPICRPRIPKHEHTVSIVKLRNKAF